MTTEAQKRAMREYRARKRAEAKAAGLQQVTVTAYPEDAPVIRETARDLRERRERVRRSS